MSVSITAVEAREAMKSMKLFLENGMVMLSTLTSICSKCSVILFVSRQNGGLNMLVA
jgi:hypothetical protein